MTKEELFIKQKVIKIVSKKNQKIVDGGKEKLVIPMESILFLTKNMNPLVSESGEINIKVSDIDDINKIALPLEAETVDPFITEFININDITVFENLIAVIVQGLGLEIIRNNKGHQIIHNIVSYY